MEHTDRPAERILADRLGRSILKGDDMTNIDEAVKRLRKWADNVAEIQARGMWAKFASDVRTILDALDAAERERDEAVHARMVERRDSNVTYQERNELAAVIEQVRASAERLRSLAGPESPTEVHAMAGVADGFLVILESAPADSLRQVKAEPWDEGFSAGVGDSCIHWGAKAKHVNPYRIKKGEQ